MSDALRFGSGAILLFFVLVLIATLSLRGRRATGLAASEGSADDTVENIVHSLISAMNRLSNTRQFIRDESCIIACKTGRTILSYGEQVVARVEEVTPGSIRISLASWNSTPTMTHGKNRRNILLIVKALHEVRFQRLTRRAANVLIAEMVLAGILRDAGTLTVAGDD